VRALAEAGIAAAVLAAASPASARACPHGRTLWRHDGLRMLAGPTGGGNTQLLLARGGRCSAYDERSAKEHWRWRAFHRTGSRLGYVFEADSGRAAPAFYLGWIDVRRPRARRALIDDGGHGRSDIPVDRLAYRIAPDGAIAVIGGGRSEHQKVALLEASPFAGEMSVRLLFDLRHGGAVPSSLRITRDEVSFRDGSGSLVTVWR